METEKFKIWLSDRGNKIKTIKNNVSCCKRIESYYGDLDKLIASEMYYSLIEDLSYTIEEERLGIPPHHRILIDKGSIRDVTNQLKVSFKKYISFYKSNLKYK